MPQSLNELSKSKSPYLQQHKDNPVAWKEWNKESLELALINNKPILLSVGYSACHWCHVMAHESFEDENVAAIMNEYFINIKVDREERPDIDQVYMEAVQAMGINGGWPLNVFLTPDQKPFYGGTYFPKEGWKKLLTAVHEAYQNNHQKLVESAEKFTLHLNKNHFSQRKLTDRVQLQKESFDHAFEKIKNRLDKEWGGFQGAPKFPMPGLWSFFGVISSITQNPEPNQHFLLTAHKMATGGIYDHIGGGFSRYSVDPEWHVPHFEKMLYDNAQLLSMYAQVHKQTHSYESYQVINETFNWLSQEMLHNEGGYFSAIDADSEGIEGKYYTWLWDEIESLPIDHLNIIKDCFDIQSEGNWEYTNVLRRLKSTDEISTKHQLKLEEIEEIIASFKSTASKIRSERIRPEIDTKIIAGWNGLMLTSLCQCIIVLEDHNLKSKMKIAAQNLFSFLTDQMIVNDKLVHIHSSTKEGFCDDYGLVILSFIDYYETFFDELALKQANQLMQYVIINFYDEEDGFFFYVNRLTNDLIASKKEIYDNVIPSSNAVIALGLIKLGTYFYNEQYISIAKQMIHSMSNFFKESIQDSYCWGKAMSMLIHPIPEIVIVGIKAEEYARQIQNQINVNYIISVSRQETNVIPLLEGKSLIDGKTTIYICHNRSCKRPTQFVSEAIDQIKELS